jgi:integrase
MQRELELKSDRQRKGLEPLPTDRWASFDEMLLWWLDGEATRFVSHDKLKSIYATHFKGNDLARLPPTAVTSGRIEAFLLPKEKKYSATYVNHMRRLVHRVFAAAIRVEEWRGSNPAEHVRRRREPKRKPSFLEAHEVVATLLEIKPFWRPLYATAIYAGLRKGELAGLERGDVDLARNLILVRHSWSRDFPKGDHEEAIPIHPELKPYLEQALRLAKGQLLFPAPNGKMLPRDFKLAEKLRSAMARAGVVLGYKHICRRCKAGRIDSHEDAPDGTIRRCPKCNAKMWPSAVPNRARSTSCATPPRRCFSEPARTSGPCRKCCVTPTPRSRPSATRTSSPATCRRRDHPPETDLFCFPLATGSRKRRRSNRSSGPKRPSLSRAWSGAGNRSRIGDPQLGKSHPRLWTGWQPLSNPRNHWILDLTQRGQFRPI